MTGGSQSSWPIWLPCRLLTVDDIAQILQVNIRTVRRMIDRGDLPREPLGRLVRVRPEALLEFLDRAPRKTKRINNNTKRNIFS
jgi:excisionase family DNA binding protein